MQKGTKENIEKNIQKSGKRKLTAGLAGILLLIAVLQHLPVISKAEGAGQIVDNLSAIQQEDAVKLQWMYGSIPDSEYEITGYEVRLETESNSIVLSQENSPEKLTTETVLENVRKTETAYTIALYGTYLIPVEKPAPTEVPTTEPAPTEAPPTEPAPTEAPTIIPAATPEIIWKSEVRLIGRATVVWVPVYKITFRVGVNGAVIYGGNSYENAEHTVFIQKGEAGTFTIQAADGYVIDMLSLPEGVTQNGEEYLFSGITDDAVIAVSFIRKLSAPELDAAHMLSTDRQNAAVAGEEERLVFQPPEQESEIFYQFVDSEKETVNPDGWISYQEGCFLENNYNCGVLKAKCVPVNGIHARESDIATWYYTTLPQVPENIEFQLNREGSNGSCDLSRDNWVTETDGTAIRIMNLPQGAVSENTWQYILYLKCGTRVLHGICTWSDEEQTYSYKLPSQLEDGIYQIGYAVKNAYGAQGERIYSESYLAFETAMPGITWKETSGNLIKKEAAESYYTNGMLNFQLGAELPEPMSGIKGYSYRIGNGEWQILLGNQVSIPIEEMAEQTEIGLRVTANNGLTKEAMISVIKDVIPPGGADGTIAQELVAIIDETGFDNKNPADASCVAVDESNENKIYYNPAAVTELVLKAPACRETDSDSRISVKYKVQKYGTSWSAEGASALAREEDGTCKLDFSESSILQKEGKYVIYIWTEDEAGNCSAPIFKTVCYDNTKPEISNISPISEVLQSGGFYFGQNYYQYFASGGFMVNFSIRETAAGICKVEYFNIAEEEKLLFSDASYAGQIQDGTQNNSFAIQRPARYKLQIKLYDMAGNSSELIWGSAGFIVDSTKPVLSVNNNAEEKWVNSDVLLQVTANDAEAGINSVEYTLGGETYKMESDGKGSQVGFIIKAEEEAKDSSGSIVTVSAHNNAGVSSSYTGRILIDKTVPEITLSGITDSRVYGEKVNLAVSIKENIYNLAKAEVLVHRQLDGADYYENHAFVFSDAESINNYSFSADGAYTVTVSAVDAAGNKAVDRQIHFTIDSTAPAIVLGGITEGEYYRENVALEVKIKESFYDEAKVKIRVIKEGEGTVKEYELPEMSLYARESKASYSFTEEGSYTIEAAAADAAGNIAETKTISFILDKTPPEVAIEGFENHLITDKEVMAFFRVTDFYYQGMDITAKIRKTDIEGKDTETAVHFDSMVGKTTESTEELTEDGKYTLYLTATDRAGNTSSLHKSFLIDTQAPVIRYMEEYDGKYFKAFSLKHTMEEMLLDFTLNDYQITLNGLYYDGISLITEEGKYLLEISARDEAGHETWGKAEFIVDCTSPMIIFSGAQDAEVSYEEIALSVMLRDEKDVIKEILINDERQQLQEGNKQSFLFQKFGTYVVQVSAEDYAGNQTMKSITVIYRKKTIFTEWMQNKPLFFATITGTMVVGGTAGGILLKRNKRKNRGNQVWTKRMTGK